MAVLRKIVLNPKWLSNLHFYVRFRDHAKIVKEVIQAYAYFPFMVYRMLDTSRGFEGSFSAWSDVDEFSPRQIAPTLAMKAPPSTGELMKAPSRFLLKPKENMGK
ncbi:hypothetical protein P5673_012161 [Acropora cervicornis]|uniref:Uncharacterized protein n=1 Tax=Acropora cervicornis TaxID=6130 RepID=A0AAD9V8H8_ACRCE|nr:hypothetical protein P5673_012161 [Acropora cervicornis]